MAATDLFSNGSRKDSYTAKDIEVLEGLDVLGRVAILARAVREQIRCCHA